MRARVDSVGCPGQLRQDRRAFRGAYGLAATNMEAAVLETVADWDVVSTHQIMDVALDAGIELSFMSGQSGLNDLTNPDIISLPIEASVRIQQALELGKSVYTPESGVVIDGKVRAAWYEIDADGALIGRLDDGSGGVVVGYAVKLFSFGCKAGLIPDSKCPKEAGSLYETISAFTGGLYGLIVPALSAASACSGGNGKICNKLATNFGGVPQKAIKFSVKQLVSKPKHGFHCTENIKTYGKAKKWAGKIGVSCPGCDFALEVIKGACAFTEAFRKTQEMVTSALADPVLDGEPQGMMDPDPTPLGERYVAVVEREVVASLTPQPVAGTVTLGHVQLGGELTVAWSGGGPQVMALRTLASDAGTLGFDPPTPLAWAGLDNALTVVGDVFTLGGVGAVDVYGGALDGGLALMGTWGEPFDQDSVGFSMAVSDAEAALNTGMSETLPPASAGELLVDGVPAEGALHSITADTLTLGGSVAGSLGAGQVTVTLAGGRARLAGYEGDLPWDTLANALGTIALTHADGEDSATLDISKADVGSLAAYPPSHVGYGGFESAVKLLTSLPGTYRFTANAPQGWTVGWAEDVLSITPPAGVPDGDYTVALQAVGQGLDAALIVPVTIAGPADATVEVAIVPDPRHAVEQRGVRTTAWRVDVTHFGPADGAYVLSAQVDHPAFVATLAATDVAMHSGDTRRIGLTLMLADGAGWPKAGTPVKVTVSATGSSTGEHTLDWTVGSYPAVLMSVSTTDLILAPGETATLPIVMLGSGNEPALPQIVVTGGAGLQHAVAVPDGPVLPGETADTLLSVTAPGLASEELPRTYKLSIEVPPTAFELERELLAPYVTVWVTVTAPGTQGLVLLGLAADAAGDEALAKAAANTYAAIGATGDADECVPEHVESVKIHLTSLGAALQSNAAAADLVDGIVDALAALDAVGCVALNDVLAALEPVGAIEPAPNLTGALAKPAAVKHGEAMVLSGQVVNTGQAPSVASTAIVTVRKNGPATIVEAVDVPALAPGESAPVSVSWDTSGSLGHHVLTLVADAQDAVAEADEADNSSPVVGEVVPEDAAPDSNQPPAVTSVPTTQTAIKTPWSYVVEATDPDGDPWFVQAPVTPPGISLTDDGLSGQVAVPGVYPVVIAILDKYGATTTQTFELDVSAVPLPNDPPVITSVVQRKLVEGVEWTYTPQALDPDGDAVTFSLTVAPDEMAMGEGTVTWTPPEGSAGVVPITVKAKDSAGNEALQAVTLKVAQSAAGPQLVITSVADDVVGVANVGDTASEATTVTAYEEHDGAPGLGADDLTIGTAEVPSLQPGTVYSAPLPFDHKPAFAGNLVYARIDPDGDVRHSAQVDVPDLESYVAFLPVDAEWFVSSPTDGTTWQLLDPVTGDVFDGGTLSAGEAAGGDTPAKHLLVQADGPLHVYVTHEIFNVDFGADKFHPTTGGERVGTDFLLYTRTVTPNNRLLVMAAENALITLDALDGEELESVDLLAGQWWEPATVTSGGRYWLSATGDVVVQSASVTGCSVVPPLPAAAAQVGDVGRDFLFSMRSRGPGGGALAVFGYEDADFVVTLTDGQTLLSGSVTAGDFAFFPNLGEQRGLSLQATGDVSVLAGDMAKAGADTIGLMGEDITQQAGRAGTEFVIHTQEQDVGDTGVLAGPQATAIDVDGEVTVLQPFEVLTLPDGKLVQITASAPVLVQTQGGGDRYFDLGDVLRRFPTPPLTPGVVLDSVSIDATACAAVVTASVRLGNGGAGDIAAQSVVELVETSPAGSKVTASYTLEAALGPGQWQDIDLSGDTAVKDSAQRSWLVRWRMTDDSLPPAWSVEGAALEPVACLNKPPEFVSTPPSAAIVGAKLAYSPSAVDPEDEGVAYALLDGPAGAKFDPPTPLFDPPTPLFDPPTPLLEWTPAPGETVGLFTIQAIDPSGGAAVQAFAVTVSAPAACAAADDSDGDGFCAPDDCDPANPAVNPAAVEVLADGVDNDCSALTPDALPPGGLGLSVAPASGVVAVGAPVTAFAKTVNGGASASAAGLSVALVFTCGDQAYETSQTVAAVGPGAVVTSTALWPAGAEQAGLCSVKATLLAGETVLAAAEATFEAVLPLSGTINATPMAVVAGDEVAFGWTLSNHVNAPVSADVVIAHPELVAFAAEAIALEALDEHAAQAVVAAPDAPAHYVVWLRADGLPLAQTLFRVHSDAEAVARYGEVVLAEPSDIDFRPLGPHPTGASKGGTLRAAWDDTGLTLAVDVIDSSEDDADRVTLSVVVDGAEIFTGAWQRDGELEAEPTEVGYRLTWTVPDVAGPGEIFARVQLRDGGPESAAIKDAWVWASSAEPLADAPQDARFYARIALDPPPEPPGQDVQDQPGDHNQEGLGDPEPAPEPPPEPDEDLGSIGGADLAPEAEPEVAESIVPEFVPNEGGCGCRTATPTGPLPWGAGLIVLLLAGAFVRLRRLS